MGREDVGLGLRKDIQVVMVFLGNFGVEGGIRLGGGKKRRERRRGRRGGGVGRGSGCEGARVRGSPTYLKLRHTHVHLKIHNNANRIEKACY